MGFEKPREKPVVRPNSPEGLYPEGSDFGKAPEIPSRPQESKDFQGFEEPVHVDLPKEPAVAEKITKLREELGASKEEDSIERLQGEIKDAADNEQELALVLGKAQSFRELYKMIEAMGDMEVLDEEANMPLSPGQWVSRIESALALARNAVQEGGGAFTFDVDLIPDQFGLKLLVPNLFEETEAAEREALHQQKLAEEGQEQKDRAA